MCWAAPEGQADGQSAAGTSCTNCAELYKLHLLYVLEHKDDGSKEIPFLDILHLNN